jgi:hypothetical protein
MMQARWRKIAMMPARYAENEVAERAELARFYWPGQG